MKFLTSQPGQETISIHILPNISRGKGEQVIKFGQVIENNKTNIFLQKSWKKCVKETSSRPLFVLGNKRVNQSIL